MDKCRTSFRGSATLSDRPSSSGHHSRNTDASSSAPTSAAPADEGGSDREVSPADTGVVQWP